MKLFTKENLEMLIFFIIMGIPAKHLSSDWLYAYGFFVGQLTVVLFWSSVRVKRDD